MVASHEEVFLNLLLGLNQTVNLIC